MTSSYDYLQVARELAGGEGPQSNAIFQALMQAHQKGKVGTLVDLSATLDRQASGARDCLHALLMRSPATPEKDTP